MGLSGGRRALHVKVARDACRVSLASCKGRLHWDFFLMRKAAIGAFEGCFKTTKLRAWQTCQRLRRINICDVLVESNDNRRKE